MNVVLVNEAPGIGGRERYIMKLASSLPESFRVTLVCNPSDAFADAVAGLSRPFPLVPLPTPTLTTPGNAVALARLLRSLRPDLVHVHDSSAALYTHPIARALGMKTVETINMSPLYYEDQSAARQAFARAVLKGYRWAAHATIFVSEHEKQLYLKHGLVPEERAHVVYNGSPASLILPAGTDVSAPRAALRQAMGVSDDATVIAFAGRLAFQKGVDYLMEAAPTVAAACPDAHIVVIGDGPDGPALRAQAERLAPGRVHFLGMQLHADVVEYLRGADVFVLPARFECFPFSTLEAMASGLPCVVTDVGGNAEAVRDGVDGAVVPRSSPGQLADALIALCTDDEARARAAANARERARTFTEERMVEETVAVYEAVTT